MVDNPHLAGVPPPPRCASCSHHPRLLPDGSCIDCGAEQAPVYTAPAAAAQPPAPSPDRGLGPSPVFSDWMRQPAPSGALTTRDKPAESAQAPAPESVRPRGACGLARRPDAEQPRAKRPRAQAPRNKGASCQPPPPQAGAPHLLAIQHLPCRRWLARHTY